MYLCTYCYSELMHKYLSNVRLKYLITMSFRYWSDEYAKFITSKLSKEKLYGADAWDEIQEACQKTVDDFKFILSDLEKFQSNELQVDQKKSKNFLKFNLRNINIIQLLCLLAVF